MRLHERCCRLVRSVVAVLATFDYIAFAVFPLPHSVSHEVLHLVQCSKYSFFSVLSLYSCFPAENFSKSYAKLSYSDAINNWLDERIKNACKTCYQENNVRYIYEMIIEIFQSTESTRICLYQKKRYSRCEPTGFFVFNEFLFFFFWNLVDSYLISMSSCLL